MASQFLFCRVDGIGGAPAFLRTLISRPKGEDEILSNQEPVA